jgi:hypothetical protein
MAEPQEMSFFQQLMYLKGLTVRTGVIHEAQAVQIRNWPLAIPGVRSAEAHVDTDQKIVRYILKPKAKQLRVTAKVKEICSTVDKFIKTILWNETTVIIEANKTVIFDSRTISK